MNVQSAIGRCQATHIGKPSSRTHHDQFRGAAAVQSRQIGRLLIGSPTVGYLLPPRRPPRGWGPPRHSCPARFRDHPPPGGRLGGSEWERLNSGRAGVGTQTRCAETRGTNRPRWGPGTINLLPGTGWVGMGQGVWCGPAAAPRGGRQVSRVEHRSASIDDVDLRDAGAGFRAASSKSARSSVELTRRNGRSEQSERRPQSRSAGQLQRMAIVTSVTAGTVSGRELRHSLPDVRTMGYLRTCFLS